MTKEESVAQKFRNPSPTRLLAIVVAVALIAGVGTGYILASTNSNRSSGIAGTLTKEEAPKDAHQDNRTFRDFAEGTVMKKPEQKGTEAYSEGTHQLIRENAQPVTLTSSVVDLTQYEGKKVKVYGETQKAIKEGWLMDVGKIEEK